MSKHVSKAAERLEQSANDAANRFRAMRNGFDKWIQREGSEIVREVNDAPRICADMSNDRLMEHYLWQAYKAGTMDGRDSR